MSNVTESIFSGKTTVIPMADVQHMELHWIHVPVEERTKHNYEGLLVITKHTTWDTTIDTWANNIYLGGDEARAFMAAWCRYRSEVDAPTPNE